MSKPTLSHNRLRAGMGGLAVAFAIWKIRGHYNVPVKDPFLDVSLRYRQPT